MPLTGKVAIVTGGAMGIGRAVAHHMAQNGARLILADIDEDGGENVASEIRTKGFEARYIHCNIAEQLDVHNLMASALEEYGRLDILLNAAAVRDNTPFMELTEEEFTTIIDVNLKGAFLLGKAAARQMIRQEPPEQGDAGSIIFISSVHSVLAEPNAVAFAVASGGLTQLTKAMSQALAPNGIRVNAIGPSNIMTPKLAALAKNDAEKEKALERAPMGRFGNPSEIASIATFLASDEASYITGQTIYADGGALSMRRALSKDEKNQMNKPAKTD